MGNKSLKASCAVELRCWTETVGSTEKKITAGKALLNVVGFSRPTRFVLLRVAQWHVERSLPQAPWRSPCLPSYVCLVICLPPPRAVHRPQPRCMHAWKQECLPFVAHYQPKRQKLRL